MPSLPSPVLITVAAATLATAPPVRAEDRPRRACVQVLDAARVGDHYFLTGLDSEGLPLIEEIDDALAPIRRLPIAVAFPEALLSVGGDGPGAALIVAGHDGDPPSSTAAIVKIDLRSGEPLARQTVPRASFRDLVRHGGDIVAVGIGEQTRDDDGDVLVVRYGGTALTERRSARFGGAGQDLARAATVDGDRLVLALQTQGGLDGAPREADDIDAWLVSIDIERLDGLRVLARVDGPGFDVLKDVDRQGDSLIAVGATQPSRPESLALWPRGPALQGLVVVVRPGAVRVERRPSVSSYWSVLGRAATAHATRDGVSDAVLAPIAGGAPFMRCALAGPPVFTPIARGSRTLLLGPFAGADVCASHAR